MKKILLVCLLGSVLFAQKIPKKNIEYAASLCNNGNAKACFDTGMLYQEGLGGIAKNIKIANNYFSQGCELNDGKACFLAAINTQELTHHFDTAISFLTKGCDLNDSASCSMMGSAYMSGGYGIEKDIKIATEYYTKACNLGTHELASDLACQWLAEGKIK